MRFAAEQQPGDFPAPDGRRRRRGFLWPHSSRSSSSQRWRKPPPAPWSSSGLARARSVEEVSLSYTLWRLPQNHEDPINLADPQNRAAARTRAGPGVAAAGGLAPRDARPDESPPLGEVVRTSRTGLEGAVPRTAESVLLAHFNDVFMNSFREQRVAAPLRLPPLGALTAQDVESDVAVIVDGAPVPGLTVSGDP